MEEERVKIKEFTVTKKSGLGYTISGLSDGLNILSFHSRGDYLDTYEGGLDKLFYGLRGSAVSLTGGSFRARMSFPGLPDEEVRMEGHEFMSRPITATKEVHRLIEEEQTGLLKNKFVFVPRLPVSERKDLYILNVEEDPEINAFLIFSRLFPPGSIVLKSFPQSTKYVMCDSDSEEMHGFPFEEFDLWRFLCALFSSYTQGSIIVIKEELFSEIFRLPGAGSFCDALEEFCKEFEIQILIGSCDRYMSFSQKELQKYIKTY